MRSNLALKASVKSIRFRSALALQCFNNDFIYEQSPDEAKALRRLEEAVENQLALGIQPSVQVVLCLASFKPLKEYGFHDKIKANAEIKEVLTRQVNEPFQEASIKAQVESFKAVTDVVSQRVKSQYENSPYPKWVNLGLPSQSETISEMVSRLRIPHSPNSLPKVLEPRILVAGCGTGQDALTTASGIKNSKVLSVDISFSSLAFAIRQARDHDIKNIEFLQADILSLTGLEKRFDIIESTGVLHHMRQPMTGWKILTDLLKPGGLMRIALYSRLARQDIVRIRDEIKTRKIGSGSADIKAFRQEIIERGDANYGNIFKSSDFYSLASVHDLLFNAEEHLFSLGQLKLCLQQLGLTFCCFDEKVMKKFTSETNSERTNNLDEWQKFEELNPDTFASMYQFWCQKEL